MVVILVVLTASQFRFSLLISHLKAKAIPVRGAIFREARLRKLKRAFCFGGCGGRRLISRNGVSGGRGLGKQNPPLPSVLSVLTGVLFPSDSCHRRQDKQSSHLLRHRVLIHTPQTSLRQRVRRI
ncbi:hypothetical protein CLM71_15625 [Serratia sp. MYb239]|nr:hypothetical protein CLM71_15625 [Serratia sp. MYb239]